MVVPRIAVVVLVGLAVVFLAGLSLDLRRRAQSDRAATLRAIQAVVGIHTILKPRRPLPALTGWAASPELASLLIDLILEHRPDHVLELGSGASTLVIAYALEQVGHGRVTALDHDASYAEQTARQLAMHGLAERATVVAAPLVDHRLDGATWRWYDVGDVGRPIDLLVVDGPPRGTQWMARYPALPILHEHLGERCRIVLDDAGREDEQAVLKRWTTEFPAFRLELRPSTKGIAILTREEGAANAHG